MFGTTIRQGWATWNPVTEHVWGKDTKVGEYFGNLAKAVERLDRREEHRERWRSKFGLRRQGRS
jgi:hypothetical protein